MSNKIQTEITEAARALNDAFRALQGVSDETIENVDASMHHIAQLITRCRKHVYAVRSITLTTQLQRALSVAQAVKSIVDLGLTEATAMDIVFNECAQKESAVAEKTLDGIGEVLNTLLQVFAQKHVASTIDH